MPSLTNWNGELSFDVAEEQLKMPTNVSEVQEIVKTAFEGSQPVTVVGALHSTTACMVGTGVVITMQNMNRILSLDPERMTVTVEAGVTLRQLCAYLKGAGFQPPVVMEFGNFQIGAISGTHACDTSLTKESQFSSFVIGVKLVTPSGDVIEISEERRADYLPAIRSHFGMFGVVAEITLRVCKLRPLRLSVETTTIDSFLASFEEELDVLRGGSDQVFGMLFPHTHKLLWQRRKYVDPMDSPESPSIDKGNVLKDVLLPLAAVGTTYPKTALAELLSAAVFEWPTGIFHHLSYIIDPCDRGASYTRHDARFEFYEWMFPEKSWCSVMQEFLDLCERFRKEKDFVLVLPALIYFLKQDKASCLSRSRFSDMMSIDPTHPDPKDATWKDFRLEFNKIAVQHGGIPHINKTRDGAIYHSAKAYDADIIRQYLEKRKKLDPKDLFLNPFFKTMFAEFI